MKRTVAMKLKVPEEELKALIELQTIFSQACNFVADIASSAKEFNRVKLHHLSYYLLKQHYPQLGAQMSCNAIAKVSQAFQASKGRRKVTFKEGISVHFDKRTYSLKNNILSARKFAGRFLKSAATASLWSSPLKSSVFSLQLSLAVKILPKL